MSTLRLFVAVDPAREVRERLRAALARARPLSPRARWVDPDALHMTLAFLGDVDEESVPGIAAALGGVASRHAPVDLRFAGAGTFGGKRPRVLWVGMTGGVAALGAVYRELGVALAPFGYAPDHADFTPHLTLARAREHGGDPALAACAEAFAAEDFGATRIEAMVLYRSELGPGGSKYTALATVPFGVGRVTDLGSPT